MRRQRGTLVLVVLLVLLLAGWWSMPASVTPPTPPAVLSSVHSALVSTSVIHHRVEGSMHWYEGELLVRDCESFSTQVQTRGSGPAHITLAFMVTPAAFCKDKPVVATFSTAFSSTNAMPPVLDAVLVNSTPVAFRVVEDR